MPLPNGVDPSGNIRETCPRAAWLGNRGVLHDANKVIFRKWATKSWVTCAMQYKGNSRKPLMQPNRYTELFFLDEATALAAGHRPCAECRRAEYNKFKAVWTKGNPEKVTDCLLSASQLDNHLHTERIDPSGHRVKFNEAFGSLPDGAVFLLDGSPHLKWRGKALRWSDTGYSAVAAGSTDKGAVTVITPRSTVLALGAGYVPQVHESAGRAS